MTTNTNDLPRTTVLIAAARAMNVSDDVLYRVVDDSLDFDAADYPNTDDERRALHTLARAMYDSDDDFDDLRLELREALDMLDDDDRRLIAMMNDDDD